MPALRLGGVAGLVPYFGVDPARHRPGAGEPERVVGVVAELRMVSAEAGVDVVYFIVLGSSIDTWRPKTFEREDLG